MNMLFATQRRHSVFPTPSIGVVNDQFALIAALQLAATTATPSQPEPALPPGRNKTALRKQGQLCLTFALRNYPAANQDRIELANAMEATVDDGFLEEEYRRRIYEVGGELMRMGNGIVDDGTNNGNFFGDGTEWAPRMVEGVGG